MALLMLGGGRTADAQIFVRTPLRPVAPPDSSPEAKISPELRTVLQSVGRTEFIPIAVVMKEQLTESDRMAALSTIPANQPPDSLRETRRRRLIDELQQLAQTEQAQLLDSLQAWTPDDVRRVRPLWIVDVICLQARPVAIQRITLFPEVAAIEHDPPRPAAGTATWAVDKIGADDLWTTPGLTGRGVVVGILDMGVDASHRDLKDHLWENELEEKGSPGVDDDGNTLIDDVNGWNFAADDDDTDDPIGHGTMISGIVAGDGTAGTSTGVAPDAQLMLLKVDTLTGETTQGDALDGMQYALDKKARIVNCSLGFLYATGSLVDRWRDAVDVLAAAGILFVTITHNDANSVATPHSIRTPGNVPLALTVSGTDDIDAAYSGNNHGPVTWQEDSHGDYPWPPGLLKPDLAAPAVSVTTTTPSSGSYVTDTGTSFSAAYTSGAAALLLEKDSSLLGTELKYLLEETALDIGDTGPDTEFGWGRLRADEAAAATIDRSPYDLAVTGTSSLWTTEDIWVDNDGDGVEDVPSLSGVNLLYARIRNLGGLVPSNVEVKFYYADVATIGISGFDPNGDGDPSDGVFTYIGSYRIPTLGPKGSKHETGIAVVNWTVPDPGTSHWCVGIGIVGANSIFTVEESDRSNNVAFRNFFEVETSTAVFPFLLAPPASDPKRPFTVEIVRQNVPETIELELVVEDGSAGGIQTSKSLRRIAYDSPVGRGRRAEEFQRALQRYIGLARFKVQGQRVLVRGVRAPDGVPVQASLVIRSRRKLPENGGRYVTINTLDRSGKATGGITLSLVDRK
ncbi:MAG TPA: S8 family serine peptidase [Candidatus Eisenbacteria bacterium]|nr:S8 family serine peptidase [Candidatus Eisenbacteria bacterium]